MGASLHWLFHPLVTAASGPAESQESADEIIERARSTVALTVGKHQKLGDLTRQGPTTTLLQDGKMVTTAARTRAQRRDDLAAFVSFAETALDTLQAIPLDDGEFRAVLWDCQDRVRQLYSPATTPTTQRERAAERHAMQDVADRAVKAVQGRLEQIEKGLIWSRTMSLTLAPGEPDAVALGGFIRLARGYLGIRSQDLTSELKISGGYLRMIERGDKVASPATYEALFAKLGLKTVRVGSSLRVRDEEGLELDVQLVPATTKAELITAAREAREDRPVITSTPDGELLREVLRLIVDADPNRLLDVRELLLDQAASRIEQRPADTDEPAAATTGGKPTRSRR